MAKQSKGNKGTTQTTNNVQPAAVVVARPAAVQPALVYAFGAVVPRHKAGHNGAWWQAVVTAINAGNTTLAGVTVKTAAMGPLAVPAGNAPLHFVQYAVRRGWLAIANAPTP